MKWLVSLVLIGASHGWWWNATSQVPVEEGPWKTWARGTMPSLVSFMDDTEERLGRVKASVQDYTGPHFDQGLWWICDVVVSFFGWAVFGSAWGNVQTGLKRLLQLGALLTVCLAFHYVWTVCYPIVSLIVGLLMALVWLLRRLLRIGGTCLFYVQKWTGGAPEAVDVTYHGPSTGKIPETSELRQFKPSGANPKWIAVKRNGSQPLVQALSGVDRVHLCRNSTCCEEGGQHFQEYGVVKRLDPERFQVAQASEGAKQTGRWLLGWMSESQSTVRKLAGRVKEFASESETEDQQKPCQAFLLGWETSEGGERLAKEPCRSVGDAFSNLLTEDRPSAVDQFCLCNAHAAQYLCKRFVNKCGVEDCFHVGFLNSEGIKKCSQHQRPRPAVRAPEGPPRRSSRSRSRSKARSASVDPPEEGDMEDDESLGEEDEGQPEDIIRRAKDSSTPPSRASRTSKRLRSPGHTPKSSIQRNLAKVGLLDSPDVTPEMTLLQDFCEKLAETKQLGWTEERVRKFLEDEQMKSRESVLRALISEAELEQAKGQRGLTKFLVRWRSALKDCEDRSRRPESDWSVIDDSRPATPSVSTPTPSVPPFPTPPPGLRSPPESEVKGRGLKIEPPSVYRADRRAAGEEERGDAPSNQMAQIAKAIQHQTAELASLVKHQTDTSAHPTGTVKGLGRQAEEMVFLLRACGQYQVGLGADEYGQALANTLLAAQVGASTRLRTAGFRQKMTSRLAVGIAGAFWGTHEKYCLGASDFVAFTDAELDAFSSETRGGKAASEQRPSNPQRLDEWLTRVKRQIDVWCLCYGEEWRAVKVNAMEKLSAWHLASPHRWPLTVIMDLWEELHWRLYEEVRELLRLLKREAGRETMTLQEVKFHALLPGPDGRAWLKMPSTFDIEEPTGWFQMEVIPRIDRKQERLLWNLTWQGNRKGPLQKEGAGGNATGTGDGNGEGDKLSVKNLWGPKLTAEETARAKERAPTDKNGTLLC
eukprot:s50_g75.t1